MGEAAALEKDGVERDLQEALAARPEAIEEGLRLERREWPTDIGPVDLMCRDADGDWVAVEIKRVGTIDAVEQLTRYLGASALDPAARPAGASSPRSNSSRRRCARRVARHPLRRGRPRRPPRRARARADAVRALGVSFARPALPSAIACCAATNCSFSAAFVVPVAAAYRF